MSRYIPFVVVVVLILGAIWYVFLREVETIDRPRAGENIIVFGDSLVEGVGASTGNDLVSLLELSIKRPILNAGKSGDTTKTALARFERDVLSQNPRIVIILLGGNDALRGVQTVETFSRLEIMIDQIHERGAAVLLLGVRGGILADKYKKEFKQVAREKEVSFVSDILDGILGHSELMYDTIHPNDKGYAQMVERISPVLRKMLQ